MDYCCFKKEALFSRQVGLTMPAGAINRAQISLIVLNDFYLRGRSSVRYTVVIQKILQALHAMFCEAIHEAKGFCKKKNYNHVSTCVRNFDSLEII